MAVAVLVLAVLVVLALLAGVHRYLWRRLVGDTTARGSALRTAGTVAAYLLPLLSVGALVAGRLGAPFRLQQVLAWPGYLWLAVVLYLTLALLVGELVRPVLRWALARRDAARGRRDAGTRDEAPEAGPPGGASSAGEGAPEAAELSAAMAGAGDGGLRTAASEAVRAGSGAHGSGTEGDASAAGARPRTDAPRIPVGAGTGDAPGADSAPGTGSATATAIDEAPSNRTDGATATRAAIDEATVTGPESAVSTGTGTEGTAGDGAGAGTPALSRRLFVARAVGGAAAVAGFGTVGYGTYGVLRGPRVKRITVPLARLPRSAHGFRIAVVSDIHLGPTLGRAHTQRIVDTINRTQPDLVAVVGDLVDGTVDDLGPAAEPLAQLDARRGSFFVTGNHEYFSGAAPWVDHVRELGLHPLENARVEIDGFDLAGVNDPAGEAEGQGPDFEAALGDRDPVRASVLLAHQPVVIDEAVAWGVDLQLSGHTHGGQLWPGDLVAQLANPTVAGLDRYGDTQLYVTRGAGAWGPPVRVGAPSDITVVELASRQF
ncbi:metallophosphoesterase [Streptomyces sp. NPDC052042]|uniref:metallophosphoesterase n=1 Tax=Streptomyces sp. NPDC052042 TaxID=3365683 RepID=UPI0037D3F86B